MIDIKSMYYEELKNDIKELGYPEYRAKQIFEWLNKGVSNFEDMSNIPKSIRENLDKIYYISVANIEKKQISAYDNTVKYLFSLPDSELIESVLMQYKHGYSICISTQVGCRMGCSFCATGKGGFSRNLTASEMLTQIEAAQRDTGFRISNIVLMGMGEPLDNYDNVLRFLRLVSAPYGLNIGMRHISLSTCGLVDKIYQLMNEHLQLTLSISLHAPNDEIRSRTMPVNKRYTIDELLKACRKYAAVTGRRISFEYAMIDGVNDSDVCALELAQKLSGMLCHVNLIPVNSVTETNYRKSKKDRLTSFCRILESRGITATIRRTLGSDIDAACGQLRGKHNK